MKKTIITIFCLTVIILLCVFCTPKKQNNKLQKIKLAEVAHSIFYAPQYVAHSLGYFEEEGLDVEIILASGADKVTAAVISGDADIGFCGSEGIIYVYKGGEKDYLKTFAGLTKRDGSFLVSREKYENFTLEDLKGKFVIGGRKGGMPEMTLEYTLKEHGINPNIDLKIDTSIAFASMGGAFIGGTGDFVSLFEPNALQIEKEGYGYVVESLGKLGGTVPYTTYNAKKSFIENNPDIIEGFTKAIQKGLDYVFNHSDEEIAKIIVNYFPDTSLEDLTKIVVRYRENDSWFSTTFINEQDFNHIQDIMKSAGELDEYVPYSELVDTTFSTKINNE